MIKLGSPIAGAILKRYPQGTISQFFGENLNPLYASLDLGGHNGIDFDVPTRTPVLAAHDGVVMLVNNDQNIPPDQVPTRGYGVWLQHADGWFTIYWHMLSPNLKVGDVVKKGDCIGYSDNTGQSTGPHLHFGLYPSPRDMNNGYEGAVDPLPYIQIGILSMIVSLLQQAIFLKGQINKTK